MASKSNNFHLPGPSCTRAIAGRNAQATLGYTSQPLPDQFGSAYSVTRYNSMARSSPALPAPVSHRPSTDRGSRGGFSSPSMRSEGITPSPGSKPMSQSPISSPQLPAYEDRPRLSLGPSLLRRPSTTPMLDRGEVSDNNAYPPSDRSSGEDADALNEIIMAIDMKDNRNLGCAYYVAAEETLLLLQDVPMAGVEIVETLLLHAKPTTILTPSRTSQALTDLLAPGAQGPGRDGNAGEIRGAYLLRTLKTADFRYESGRDKLLSLDIQTWSDQAMAYVTVADEGNDARDDFDIDYQSRPGSLLKLGTSVDFGSRLTVGCAGAVLSDIQRRKTAQYLPNDPDALVAFRIRTVEMFALFDSMFINADTLVSLQIIQSEYHPNSQMRGPDKSTSAAKESLSVYGLFHHLACTPQGKSKLRQIFLRPSIDIELIRSRQETIAFFLRHAHWTSSQELCKDLRKVQNMRSSIISLQKGVDNKGMKVSVTSSVWAAVQRFALHALQIRDTLAQMAEAEKIPIVRKVIEVVDPRSIHQVGELISQIIDFEQSAERGRTAVKQGVDANLDEIKRQYDGMEDFLTEVNQKLRMDIPEWAQPYVQGCVFLPQLGFLTVVAINPETGRGNYEGEGLDDIWERMFVAEGVVYCKNRRMKEMDEQCGDAYCMIIDREVEIIHELSTRVLGHEEAILATSDVLGELDSILALANGCAKYNWVAPRITADNVLHIEAGRHPLQELIVPSFVPNDCHLTGGIGKDDEGREIESSSQLSQQDREFPSSLILTGPNHSGKSVYLKQVALIVYLAHIGCFVPAERADIGITDRILTRIATRESVARRESAFAIDLRQAAFAMNFATHRSLILIDEFGKGTDSSDGAGLMTALMEHFISLGSERPKVLVATHFHEIFESGFLEVRPELEFAHMDVRVDSQASTAEDQLTYLFKLMPGRNLSSFGSRCAAMNGIDEAIINRAEAISLLLARNEDLEAACGKLSDNETRELEEAEAVARAFLEEDIEPPPKSGRALRGNHKYRDLLERVLSVDASIMDAT